MKNTAIVLAGGAGSRMKSHTPKQYMELLGKPVLYYALAAFENSSYIDDIILVTRQGEESYCRQLAETYGLKKIRDIVPGGAERYLSVYQGLLRLKQMDGAKEDGLVYIHDGARPCLTWEVIEQLYDEGRQYGAVIAGVPVKDTIKMVDASGEVVQTPPREQLWQIQTPQVFSKKLIINAYENLIKSNCTGVTDDAMVIEKMTKEKVHVTYAGYENIKITTPEDIEMAELFLKKILKEDKI